jgi:DNA repair exonuclease SbcCD ATPase subunit
MKLINLTILNFRGIQSLLIEPLGRNVNVYGINGAGKTTIEDAFLWLLFGKDSSDRKDYRLKPVDENGNEVLGENFEPTVAAHLEYFGKVVKLKKSYLEEWPKKGELKGQYTGSTTHYYIDDLEVKAGEYQGTVDKLVDMKLFKLLTNPRYFIDVLTWQERRETLVKIVGDLNIVPSPELEKLMNGRKFEDYHALGKQKIKEKQKQLEGLPYAISAVHRMIPTNLPELPDINALTAKKSELENQLMTLKSDDASNAKRREIAQIETEIAEARNKYQAEVDEYNRKIRGGIDNLGVELSLKQFEKNKVGTELTQIEFDINRMTFDKSHKLDEYHAVYDRQWTGSELCPTCGQPLPEDVVATAKAKFNLQRSQDLERLKTEGMTLKSQIETKQSELEENQKLNETLNAELTVLNARIEKGKAMLKTGVFDPGELAIKLGILKFELLSGGNNLSQINDYEFKIAQIKDQIKNAERTKIQLEQKVEQEKRVEALAATEKTLNSELGKFEKAVNLCENHVKAKAKALEQAVNDKFKFARFRMFSMQKNGEEAECCDVVYPNGSTSLSTGEQIQTGIDIINTLADYYGVDAPIWIDNAEGITLPLDCKAQLINLVVSKNDKKLRIEILG